MFFVLLSKNKIAKAIEVKEHNILGFQIIPEYLSEKISILYIKPRTTTAEIT